jgi:hypothetical protein
MVSRTSARERRVAKFLAIVALALVLGFALAGHADAKTHTSGNGGASVAKRTRIQQVDCQIGGGSSTTVPGANGSSTTSCDGGLYDGQSCTNRTSSTTCTFDISTPTQGAGGLQLPRSTNGNLIAPPDPTVVPKIPATSENSVSGEAQNAP